MQVWASNPWSTTGENTKVRNFKFKTEQDDAPGWFVLNGEDCWNDCGGAGQCSECGANGFCCSKSNVLFSEGDVSGDSNS